MGSDVTDQEVLIAATQRAGGAAERRVREATRSDIPKMSVPELRRLLFAAQTAQKMAIADTQRYAEKIDEIVDELAGRAEAGDGAAEIKRPGMVVRISGGLRVQPSSSRMGASGVPLCISMSAPPYGYSRERLPGGKFQLTPREHEQRMMEYAAAQAGEGREMVNIVMDMTSQGMATRTGTRWTVQRLKAAVDRWKKVKAWLESNGEPQLAVA